MSRFGPGDPLAHIVKSHAWFWKPHFSAHGHDDTITLQWLFFHARVWRRRPPPLPPGFMPGFLKRLVPDVEQPEPRCPTDICSLCFPAEPCRGASCPVCRVSVTPT